MLGQPMRPLLGRCLASMLTLFPLRIFRTVPTYRFVFFAICFAVYERAELLLRKLNTLILFVFAMFLLRLTRCSVSGLRFVTLFAVLFCFFVETISLIEIEISKFPIRFFIFSSPSNDAFFASSKILIFSEK